MSNLRTYIVTKDFKSPQVLQTGISHSPAQIAWKAFKKGTILKGELKRANGKPAFILVGRMTVVPLDNVKRLVTQEVPRGANFTGTEEKSPTSKAKEYMKKTAPKVKYVDAIILGALVGGVGFWFAEKKNLITSDNPKNKFYAAGAGAALALYILYRSINKSNKPKIK
jgi:hypothetical protein